MQLFGDSNLLQALGRAVLNSLWQMAFLWVIFQVLLSFRIYRSSAKSRLATFLLGVGFAWFMYTLVSFWIIDPSAVKRSLLSIGMLQNGKADWNEELRMILPFASAAYLLLLIIPTAQFIRNYRFVRVLRAKGL